MWRAIPLALAAVLAGGAVKIVQDTCGPFTDVTPGFCPYVLELYYLGITVGTSATTFSPDDPLTRGQAAVFVAKGLDQSLARSNRRAALGQWWTTTPHYDLGLGVTNVNVVNGSLQLVACDGADVWIADFANGGVARVRANDGKLLETWTGATAAVGVLAALGRVFVPGETNPGSLYMVDPSQPAGAVTTVASNLGNSPIGIAFDGARIWTVNSVVGGPYSVSIVTPGPTLPWSVTTVSTGFASLQSIIYDGNNVWVAANFPGRLLRLDSNGAILQTVQISTPGVPTLDGVNIWVPTVDSVQVVRASPGDVIATITGNGLTAAYLAAFDGKRILVTNFTTDSLSLFDAADFAPQGSFPLTVGSQPLGACSDGISFFVSLSGKGQLARF